MIDGLRRLSGATLPEPEAREAAGEYLRFTRDHFGEQSPGGGDWPALAPSTIRQRISRGYGGPAPILIQSGKLYTSLFPGAAGNLIYADPFGFDAGTDVFYSAYHQHGTGRMPARVILVDPDEPTSDELKRIMGEGLLRAAGVP